MLNRRIKKRNDLCNAYGRKHVFSAVLLNLKALGTVHYNENAWAMEDVGFNMDVDKLFQLDKNKGLIVKYMRFVAQKKYLDHGGVVLSDVPEDVKKMLDVDPIWSKNKIKSRKRPATTRITSPEVKRRNISYREMFINMNSLMEKFERKDSSALSEQLKRTLEKADLAPDDDPELITRYEAISDMLSSNMNLKNKIILIKDSIDKAMSVVRKPK